MLHTCEILDVVFIVHTALERTSDKAATMGSAVGVGVMKLPSPSENVLLVDAPVIGEVEVEVVLVDFVLDFSPLVDPVTALELELELAVLVLDLGVVVTAAAAVALVVTAVAVAEALVVAVAVGVGVLPSH